MVARSEGTYNSNPLACAAVVAAMAQTGQPGFYDELLGRGQALADGLVQIATDHGLEAVLDRVGWMFQLWFAAAPPTDYRSSQRLVATSPFPTFFRELLARGVLIQPPQEGLFLMSAAHTDDDVEQTLNAAREAMPAVARAVSEGRIGSTGGVR